MDLGRRAFVTGLAAAPALLAARRGAAAPILSPENFGVGEATIRHANAWLEVSRSAFEANIQRVRDTIGPKVKICAVMKADAYGHGAALLVKSVIAKKVECIGFTSNEEARIARALGFHGALARLRLATPGEIEDGLHYDIQELVSNLDYARDVAEIGRAHRKRVPIHLALNSAGMSRNGIEVGTEEGMLEALEIPKLHELELVGIMTHFPIEEEPDVRKSLAAFNEQSAAFIARGRLDRTKLTLHTANSFATLMVPESRLDMVRTGGALYGDTVEGKDYERVATFKSAVASVLHFPAGDTVSYDRTWKLARPSILANIPVGYSDGLRRIFSNGNDASNPSSHSVVLIHGTKVPLLGRVTMNTFMADVTDLAQPVKIGDEVVLVGRQGGAEITYSEIEASANTNETSTKTIAADLYTVWGNSLPKILVS